MPRDIGRGSLLVRGRHLLNIFWDCDVTDSASRQGSLNGLVHDIIHMRGAHHALVVFADVHEELVQINVLLVMSADQIMKGMASNCQHWLTVALGVVQTIEQVNAAGAGGCQAHAQLAGIFSISAGGKGGCFLMPHLDEFDVFLVRTESFKNAVDSVSRKSKNGVNAPIYKALD